MIWKWKVKNPLTIEERKKIKEGIDLHMSYREIAMHVNRSKSTIIRECKRLGSVMDYHPVKAQKHFEEKQKSVGRKKCPQVQAPSIKTT